MPLPRPLVIPCSCSALTASRTFAPLLRQADDELQGLLEKAGGDGSHSIMEQLDVDGDGEVTWVEFEQRMLAAGG